jgi:hypothetical protein
MMLVEDEDPVQHFAPQAAHEPRYLIRDQAARSPPPSTPVLTDAGSSPSSGTRQADERRAAVLIAPERIYPNR